MVIVKSRDSVLQYTRMEARWAITGVFVLVVMSRVFLMAANWYENRN
jgi:hypothetical protein